MPILVVGINGGYFPAICGLCNILKFQKSVILVTDFNEKLQQF